MVTDFDPYVHIQNIVNNSLIGLTMSGLLPQGTTPEDALMWLQENPAQKRAFEDRVAKELWVGTPLPLQNRLQIALNEGAVEQALTPEGP
jgi:hypothetical protein